MIHKNGTTHSQICECSQTHQQIIQEIRICPGVVCNDFHFPLCVCSLRDIFERINEHLEELKYESEDMVSWRREARRSVPHSTYHFVFQADRQMYPLKKNFVSQSSWSTTRILIHMNVDYFTFNSDTMCPCIPQWKFVNWKASQELGLCCLWWWQCYPKTSKMQKPFSMKLMSRFEGSLSIPSGNLSRAGCPAPYFFLLFHKIPTFSYFLALEGKISSYFLLFSWNSTTFFWFCLNIFNFQVNFEDFRKFSWFWRFQKIFIQFSENVLIFDFWAMFSCWDCKQSQKLHSREEQSCRRKK